MGYTRSCDGNNCANELKCESSTSCGANPSGVTNCNPDYCDSGYDDEGVGGFYLEDGKYWTRKRICSDEVLSDWQFMDSDSGDDSAWKSDGVVHCPALFVNSYGYDYEDLKLQANVGYYWQNGIVEGDVAFGTELDDAGLYMSSGCTDYDSSFTEDYYPNNCDSNCKVDSKAILYDDFNCNVGCDGVCEDENYGIQCSADLYYKEYEDVYDNQYCDVPYSEEVSIDSVVKTNQDVDCYVNVESLVSEPDEIKVRWYINGEYYDREYEDCSEGLDCDKTFTLSNSLYSKGDTIQCEARGYGDDGGHGAYVSSSIVTVSNIAPSLNSMSLSDGIVLINDSITVSTSSSDVDYDDLNLRCCKGSNCNPSSPNFCTSNNNYCVVLIDDSYSVGENSIKCAVYDGEDYSSTLERTFLVNQGEFATHLNYPVEGENFYKGYIKILFDEAVNKIGNIVTYALEYSNNAGANWVEIISNYGVENKFDDETSEKVLNMAAGTNETVYVKIPKNAEINKFQFSMEGL